MVTNWIILLGVYGLALAAGHVIVNRAGQMPLSLGAWLALPAYACAACLKAGTPFAIALAAGMLAGLLAAVLHWALAVRLAKLSFTLSTLALQQLLLAMLASLVIFGGRQGIFGIVRPNTTILTIVAVLALVGLSAGLWAMRRTRFAKTISALRQDRLAAEGIGIRPAAVWLKLYLLSGALMGGAGILYCLHLGSVMYAGFSVHLSVLLLLATIAVRIAGPLAPLAGAALLVCVPEMLRALPFGVRNPEFLRNIVFAVLAICVLLAGNLRRKTRRVTSAT